jgi:hypothetical protein
MQIHTHKEGKFQTEVFPLQHASVRSLFYVTTVGCHMLLVEMKNDDYQIK